MNREHRSCLVLVLIAALSVGVADAGCGDGADNLEDAEATPPELGVIIGNDDRTVPSSTAYPFRSVAAVRWTTTTERASCSAFKVGPRHLVSAAHCFFANRSDGSFGAVTTRTIARLVFGQRGSGNAVANMPVDGHKIAVEDVFVPDGWIDSAGTDYTFDWAVVRLADADSSNGWYKISSWTNEQLSAFSTPLAVGYPLHGLSCANSPLASRECGGFEYQATAGGLRFSSSFLDVQTDWDTGQSGGPLFGSTSGVSQKSALGIVVRSNEQTIKNFARRFTPEIVHQVCQDIFTHPSTTHSHECEQSPTALQ